MVLYTKPGGGGGGVALPVLRVGFYCTRVFKSEGMKDGGKEGLCILLPEGRSCFSVCLF